jgi:chloramphenicol 3-O phosphotransferase
MHSDQFIVLTGGSGTGKSTLARALQEQLLSDQWLHFSTDSILYCLPQSTLDAANNRNDWSKIDVQGVRRSAYACLRTLLEAGNRVIFDCVVMTDGGARELLVALRDFRPLLIGLTCTWEEIKRRTVTRGNRTVEEAEHGFRTSGHHLDPDRTIDTTSRDPADVTREVLSMLRSHGRDAWKRNISRLGV